MLYSSNACTQLFLEPRILFSGIKSFRVAAPPALCNVAFLIT